jgi:uncharacterized protein (DUF2249 family)
MTGDTETERVVEVNDIDPRHRHMVIQQLFEHLTPGDSLRLVVDHDPKPLLVQLETRYGAQCRWNYLEQGPDTWHVRLQRRLIAGG